MVRRGKFQSTFPIQGTTSWRSLSRSCHKTFQSTFPIQGTTMMFPLISPNCNLFQSTFPIQGTTPLRLPGSDTRRNFNPRSLYRERRVSCWRWKQTAIFQSTFPIQGTTMFLNPSMIPETFQSTFPIQVTTTSSIQSHCIMSISIHVPYTGNDGRPC